MKKSIRRLSLILLFSLLCIDCEKGVELHEITLPSDSALKNADRYALVVTTYVALKDQPNNTGISVGYARQKDVFKVHGITITNENNKEILWVNVGEGWLPRDTVQLYASEKKAQTEALSY